MRTKFAMAHRRSIKKVWILLFLILKVGIDLSAQDTSTYKLRLSISLLDAPQNFETYGNLPSMNQSVELANDLYDVSFWGINALGNAIIKNRKNTQGGRIANTGMKYITGLAFSYYGSELPVPLGVYNHEEFHRSVLGVNGYKALNGNWIFNRWDGTVYGMTDEALTNHKQNDLNGLLYSYVAGVQSETYVTQVNVIEDFYHKRIFYKNPLYLYNAWYVWNYFRFSASSESDSAKVLAPPHEDSNPYYRDYTGADLTAWVYDMYSPAKLYTYRDPFPDGEGVNRRIGYGDLNPDGQDFLKKQKNLALLNFINPAIFMINRIKISQNLSFLLFMQYNPTHFGNDIALYLPFKFNSINQLLVIHNYNNDQKGFFGLQYGLFDLHPFPNKKIGTGGKISIWSQPKNQGFFDSSAELGGSLEVQAEYKLMNNFSTWILAGYKTEGWMIGNPYLEKKGYARVGFAFNLSK
ncbi:MAG: hypothetical protein JW731_16250 [Bacteroidales bacterium]|nr:hypothetical protein [Bacteroidales bacterium]